MQVELVLFANDISHVLVVTEASGESTLPMLSLDYGCRLIEGISKWCRAILLADVYCLSLDGLAESNEDFVAVARTLTDSTLCGRAGYEWLPVSVAQHKDRMKHSLSGALQRLERYRLGQEADVFGSFHWPDRLITISQAAVGGCIRKFTHFNTGTSFSLIKLETEAGAYWFKAVGSDNIREYQVAHYLHWHFPGFVPAIAASYPEWNGWLSENVDGPLLADIHGVEAWRDVFARFAELQTLAIAHLDNLQRCGAVDWILQRMSNLMGQFFSDMPAVMSGQEKQLPARLSGEDLGRLHDRMVAICLEMQSLDIPDTILHGDLCPRNIVVSGHGPVFLDWAETYVGNPFLNAEFLLCYFRNHFALNEADAVIRDMRAAFNGPWLKLLAAETIQRAWQLAACLAPLLSALSLSSINAHNAVSASKQDAYRRTLVRVMKRESECLEMFACQ